MATFSGPIQSSGDNDVSSVTVSDGEGSVTSQEYRALREQQRRMAEELGVSSNIAQAAQENLQQLANRTYQQMSESVASDMRTAGLDTVVPPSSKNHKKLQLTKPRVETKFKKVLNSIQKKEEKKIQKLEVTISKDDQQIVNIKKDIEKNREKLAKRQDINIESKLTDISKEIKEIEQLPKVDAIYSYGQDILIETKELYVKDFFMNKSDNKRKMKKKPKLLGRFSIRIGFRDNHAELIVSNMDFISDIYDSPTIENGRCCWGNIGGDITKDLAELKIKEFVEDMIAYLESPSNKDAYISWRRYFEDRVERKFRIQDPVQKIYLDARNVQSGNWYFSNQVNDLYTDTMDMTTMFYASTGPTGAIGVTGYTQSQMSERDLMRGLIESFSGYRFFSDRIITQLMASLQLEGQIFVSLFFKGLLPEGSDYSAIQLSGRRRRGGCDLFINLTNNGPIYDMGNLNTTSALSPVELVHREYRLFIQDSMISNMGELDRSLRWL